jgi:glycine cleavage system H protein
LFPDDLHYTREHEWVRIDGDRVRVGITDFAQESLGDIVFVSLPAVGAAFTAGASFGEVESTKSVSDVYAPVTGTVTAANDALESTPELLNSDPYGEGWLVEIAVGAAGVPSDLLDAEAYRALVQTG